MTEQGPEETTFPALMNNADFRLQLFSHFLEIRRKAEATVVLAGILERIPFSELTPEIWARIVQLAPDVRTVGEYTIGAMEVTDGLADDKRVQSIVQDLSEKSQDG